eukprot:m.280042 g.280042  ORF g.280042 m.280042 type:complete len:51 (+) comp125267_c0_seq1:62-214(+)
MVDPMEEDESQVKLSGHQEHNKSPPLSSTTYCKPLSSRSPIGMYIPFNAR